jgi:hypothetical protein
VRRILLFVLAFALTPVDALSAELGVDAVNALVPRRIKLSVAAERSWISVDARILPADIGATDWSAWDRDGSGAIEAAESSALTADLKRLELAHLSVSVDGVMLPVTRMNLKMAEVPATLGLDARVVLKLETQWVQPLAVGVHRLTIYDQPHGKDGVVPFRLSFGRGLRFDTGGGARAEIRGGGQRVEVVTTKQAPIFWGTFVRRDEAATTP